MLTIIRITDTDTDGYRLMERLLTQAFPQDEYRELNALRDMTGGKEIFHNNLICDDETPVGLITYWDFGAFHYVEHFATLPEMRNRGYGRQVLDMLKERLGTPIVLEVETPDDETSRRRIAFYERQGFRLWQGDYMQPPYRKGGRSLPMHLMAWGDIDETTSFDNVRDTIYKEVYGQEQKIA